MFKGAVMNEWAIFGVIVAIIAYTAAVAGPLLKLNTAITTLTVTMKAFEGNFTELTAKNGKSHDRMWEALGKQNDMLDEHGTRITILEEKTHNGGQTK